MLNALLLMAATLTASVAAAEPFPSAAAPAMTPSELDSTTGSVAPPRSDDEAYDVLRGHADATRDALATAMDVGTGNEIRLDAAAIDLVVESLGLSLDAAR